MAIAYHLWRVIAYLISLLPFRLLYIKSTFLHYLLYDVFRYRRKVVMRNLENSFPERSARERSRIARQFYRNLADIMLEVVKTESMKPHQLKDRFRFKNIEILEEFSQRNQGVLIGIGHCGNWEWSGPAILMHTQTQGYAIVKPLNDPRFNRYMEDLRAHFFKNRTIPFKQTLRHLLAMKDEAFIAVLAADQTPTRQESKFWTTFLNQETPFFEGLGKIAHSMGLGVLYLDIRRIDRGRYEGEFKIITRDGTTQSVEEIVIEYVKHLESHIMRYPDNWLWSHRRWKHKRNMEILHHRE